MNSAFDRDRIHMTFEPGGDFIVTGDKERIAQVICNLLSNAIKFTPEGAVSVAAKKSADGQSAIVSVRDGGCGIHDSMFPKMFEKFATRSEKGIGLGLFISKSIVEAHGGRIWAENNKGCSGATVAFSLPLAK